MKEPNYLVGVMVGHASVNEQDAVAIQVGNSIQVLGIHSAKIVFHQLGFLLEMYGVDLEPFPDQRADEEEKENVH